MKQLVWLIRRLLEAGDNPDARGRSVAAEFLAGRIRHPPEPSAPSRARTARISSNMGNPFGYLPLA